MARCAPGGSNFPACGAFAPACLSVVSCSQSSSLFVVAGTAYALMGE